MTEFIKTALIWLRKEKIHVKKPVKLMERKLTDEDSHCNKANSNPETVFPHILTR